MFAGTFADISNRGFCEVHKPHLRDRVDGIADYFAGDIDPCSTVIEYPSVAGSHRTVSSCEFAVGIVDQLCSPRPTPLLRNFFEESAQSAAVANRPVEPPMHRPHARALQPGTDPLDRLLGLRHRSVRAVHTGEVAQGFVATLQHQPTTQRRLDSDQQIEAIDLQRLAAELGERPLASVTNFPGGICACTSIHGLALARCQLVAISNQLECGLTSIPTGEQPTIVEDSCLQGQLGFGSKRSRVLRCQTTVAIATRHGDVPRSGSTLSPGASQLFASTPVPLILPSQLAGKSVPLSPMTATPAPSASLSLLTDLYQLTMAYGYWKLGRAEHEAVFHLFFRRNPFRGGYAVAAGLQQAIEFLDQFQFADDDLRYLAGLQGNDGAPLFEQGFLDYLGEMRFSCDVDAVPEGTVMFPHAPLLRIKGPILQGQLIETPLLNIINFATLIATKSARICAATGGEPVLEFGLRRAQGVDGALSASRAAFIGGCAATSNCLAGKRFGIPVKGTHAHSWVMSFASEMDAFESYARAMPNNCVFLVDTYDTVEGVKKAIEVGKKLRTQGHQMVGIRLDSGDLCALSIAARKLLDEAGFPEAAIVASNDLDEYRIAELKRGGSTIGVWGVGTRLATAYDQPALGGVYKLAAIRAPGEDWLYKVKLSEQAIKVSNPGVQQVRRFTRDGKMLADVIYDQEIGIHRGGPSLTEAGAAGELPEAATASDLLQPIYRAGQRSYDPPPLADSRARTLAQLQALDPATKTTQPSQTYPVLLEGGLADLKQSLIDAAKPDQAS